MAFLDAGIILLYFVIMIGVGFWYRKKAAEDLESYFLGGKRMSWLTLAMSGSVSTFDITGTMWMISVLFVVGMQSWWNHWMWGVMLPAFGLAYMAVWVRRSGVITGAEWMVTRFGEDHGGRAARTAYALLAVITQASMIGFTFQGIGKFATVYIPLEELATYAPYSASLFTTYEAETLAIGVFFVTTFYVVMGGLYGVVITDVIQTVVLTFAGIVIAIVAYNHITPAVASEVLPEGWAALQPSWRLERFQGTNHAAYELFGALAIVWVLKGMMLNAGGPGQMFDFQRYLAARDARDAAKVAAAWPFFLVIRWAMVAGIALLAFTGFANISDPELVMPTVLQQYLPAGVRGLVIAGLLASFMSTFSSTVNSGASYIVRDLWQPFIEERRTEDELMRYSYVATIGMVVLGTLIGFQADSLAQIFDWIMMALGSGVIIPNILRWHWWRLNGWGYAAGTVGGILLSLVVLFLPSTPLYVTFPVIVGGSLVGCLAGSLLTAPTNREVLCDFYQHIRPFGLWGPVQTDVRTLPADDKDVSRLPVGRIAVNTLIAAAGITGLYVGPMYLVGHWFLRGFLGLGAALAAAVVLYFTWYRYLPAPGEEPAVDAARSAAAQPAPSGPTVTA